MAIDKDQLKEDIKRNKKESRKSKKGNKPTGKPREKRKKSGPLKGALTVLVVFALLFGAAYAAFTFNWFDARGLAAEWLDVTSEVSQRREARLADWETGLQRDAQKLADDQKTVKAAEQEVAGREDAVSRKEDELARKLADTDELQAQLQSKKDDISNVVRIVEGMSSDTAAAMLGAMKDRTAMLEVFSQLKPATQAAILETMDAGAAAALIESFS